MCICSHLPFLFYRSISSYGLKQFLYSVDGCLFLSCWLLQIKLLFTLVHRSIGASALIPLSNAEGWNGCTMGQMHTVAEVADEPWARCMLTLLWNSISFTKCLHHFLFPRAVSWSSTCSTSLTTVGMVSLLSFELLIAAWWDPILVLVYDSLVIIDVELKTMDQCVCTYLPSCVKEPLKYLAHFEFFIVFCYCVEICIHSGYSFCFFYCSLLPISLISI